MYFLQISELKKFAIWNRSFEVVYFWLVFFRMDVHDCYQDVWGKKAVEKTRWREAKKVEKNHIDENVTKNHQKEIFFAFGPQFTQKPSAPYAST